MRKPKKPELRYSLGGRSGGDVGGLGHTEVGALLGITRQDVQGLERRAIRKLWRLGIMGEEVELEYLRRRERKLAEQMLRLGAEVWQKEQKEK